MHASAAASYSPRGTAESDLASLVREHGRDFVSEMSEGGVDLASFVAKEFEKFGGCGDFQRGFLHASCLRCGHELFVAFSCKSRSLCPSCMGRRMGETAALLVDHVLPETKWRHVTLTFAGPLAVRMGYNKTLLSQVLDCAGRRIDSQLRRKVKNEHGRSTVANLHSGAFTVVQRFKFDLGLYVHAHMLWIDGAYECNHRPDCVDAPEFLEADEWAEQDLKAIVGRLDGDIRKLLEELEDDPDQAGIAACAQLGRTLGQVGPKTIESSGKGLLVHGEFAALHAAAAFDGRDRRRLERQIRYMLRPPCALDAVTRTDDGQVRLDLKNGRHVKMSPRQLMARLAGLVAPPYYNMCRYRGVLAGRHHLRSRIVYDQSGAVSSPEQLSMFENKDGREEVARVPKLPATPARIAWSKLLKRVFLIDVEVCGQCGGKMKIDRAVTEPEMIAAYLKRGPRKGSIGIEVVSEQSDDGGRRPGLRVVDGGAGEMRERGPPDEGRGVGQTELFGLGW